MTPLPRLRRPIRFEDAAASARTPRQMLCRASCASVPRRDWAPGQVHLQTAQVLKRTRQRPRPHSWVLLHPSSDCTHEGFAASSVSVAFCGGGKRLSLARLNLPHSCAPHHRRVGARAEGSQAFNQGHREGVGGERADADAGLSSVDFEVVRRTCLRSIRPGCGHRRVD